MPAVNNTGMSLVRCAQNKAPQSALCDALLQNLHCTLLANKLYSPARPVTAATSSHITGTGSLFFSCRSLLVLSHTIMALFLVRPAPT